MAVDMKAFMFSMCMHACMGQPPHTHTHPHPPICHPQGTPRISWTSITLELIKIFQFHLKIWNLWRIAHPWVGVWFGGWVGGLMGGVRSKHYKFKKCWLNQDNSILFEDLWFVETPHPWVGVCMGGWMGGSMVGSGQMTNNLINLDLIETIQFCLKIYDL